MSPLTSLSRDVKRGREIAEPWTHYWDYDRDRLKADPAVWVDWLETRVDRHILFRLDEILGWMRRSERGWVLIYAHSLFGAVEGLSTFAYQVGSDGEKFRNFCKDYFLPDPCPWPGLDAAMYDNFRCGLAHGFGIEKGGLTFKENVRSDDPVTVDGDAYWLDPTWLLERLRAAAGDFFGKARIAASPEEASLHAQFAWFLGRTSLQPPPKRI